MEVTIDYTQFQNKKVLITGGLGFIGSNLAQQLIKHGAEVTLFDACLDPYGWNFTNVKEIEEDVRFVKGDVRDRAALERIARR
ncbi:MAG: SDR family NAD(P)-dependent oxidoreductase, partial [bacterium]